MTPGERLKIMRMERAFTLKALGKTVGYPEESADIRIAQYEANKRGLTKNVAAKLATALNVSPKNFSSHICETPEELYRSMVWIEQEYGEEAVISCYDDWYDNGTFQDTGIYDENEVFERKFG